MLAIFKSTDAIEMKHTGSGAGFHCSYLLLVGSVVQLLAGCARQQEIRPEAVRPVKTMVVDAGEGIRERVFPGRVEASTTADLAFPVPGVLIRLPVTEGQHVTNGEVLAQLRDDEFRARLQTLQGQLEQSRAALRSLQAGVRPEERSRLETQVRAAEAKLANARAESQRNATMFQAQAISRQEFERGETAYRVAQEEHQAALHTLEMSMTGRQEDIEARESEVHGLEGRVVEANIQLNDSTLRAPYDGVIGRRFVEVNQNVRPGEPIVRFQDAKEIDIAVDVPESVMTADIRTADIVNMVAQISGAPGLEFPVRIREIAQVADPVTQTFNVRVAMKAPPKITVLPGMSATITVNYRRAGILGRDILVPISAISRLNTGEQVAWVLGKDDVVKPHHVKIGDAMGGQIEVLEGLKPGDRIAVAGVTYLHEGMKVRDLGDALASSSP